MKRDADPYDMTAGRRVFTVAVVLALAFGAALISGGILWLWTK